MAAPDSFPRPLSFLPYSTSGFQAHIYLCDSSCFWGSLKFSTMYRWQPGWIRWSLQLHLTIAGHSAITCLTTECLEKQSPAAHMADRNRLVWCLVGPSPSRNYAAWLTKRCGLCWIQTRAADPQTLQTRRRSSLQTLTNRQSKCCLFICTWFKGCFLLTPWTQFYCGSISSWGNHLVWCVTGVAEWFSVRCLKGLVSDSSFDSLNPLALN